MNLEVEMMSNEELDQVAGGWYDRDQLADDSRFLNVLLRGMPSQPERHNWALVKPEKMIDAWKSVGIELVNGSIFGGHYYYLNGEKISQLQAWNHAQDVVGKSLKCSYWDW